MNIQRIFEYNSLKIEINQRISFSNLNKLLKAVKNSPDNLSFSDYRKIQFDVINMSDILLSQKSNKFKEKKEKINQVYNSIQKKLSPEARTERAQRISDKLSTDLQNAITKIEGRVESLVSRVDHAEKQVKDTIAALPTREARNAANEILLSNRYRAFASETAITQRLFPKIWDNVERNAGLRSQYRDHPQKYLWTSLENTCRVLQQAKASLSTAERYKNDPAILILDKPNAEGKIELNQRQLKLLDFARKCN